MSLFTFRRLTRIFFWALIFAALIQTAVWACPMCKAFVADEGTSGNAEGLARGFALSIMTMLAMPFILVGSIGTIIYRGSRRRSGRTQG